METDELKFMNEDYPNPSIIEEWNEEHMEVRMSLPALEGTGKKGTYVFYGSFALMEWEDGDFADPANMDNVPKSIGGRGEAMSYRENKAANKGRRRL